MNKLQAITKGSKIIDQVFLEILEIIKSGKPKTEIEIANFIRRRGKQLGAQTMAFPPIVSFGRSAVEIHHKPDKTKIGKNNFLMLDFGMKVSGYCSDFTRTLFIGSPNSFHKKIYNLILLAQREGIKKVAAGKYGDEIDFAIRHIINQAGMGKYYTHGGGHGVSKKIHDSPSFKPNSGDLVKNNDIVTIEPGIYIPNKFGIRIEDMVLISRKKKIFSQIPTDFRSMTVK